VTIYADYDPEERELLRASIQSAAVAISASSLGRKEETVSEGYAAADFVLKSQPAYVGNTLVTSVLAWVQAQIKADHVFPDYVEVASAPGALKESMIVLRRAAALLDAKARQRKRPATRAGCWTSRGLWPRPARRTRASWAGAA